MIYISRNQLIKITGLSKRCKNDNRQHQKVSYSFVLDQDRIIEFCFNSFSRKICSAVLNKATFYEIMLLNDAVRRIFSPTPEKTIHETGKCLILLFQPLSASMIFAQTRIMMMFPFIPSLIRCFKFEVFTTLQEKLTLGP